MEIQNSSFMFSTTKYLNKPNQKKKPQPKHIKTYIPKNSGLNHASFVIRFLLLKTVK